MNKSSKKQLPISIDDEEQGSIYWRPLERGQKNIILEKYSRLRKVSGRGIFSPTRRERLLTRTKKRDQITNKQLWSEVRAQTRDSLVDLELLSDVMSFQQAKEMFQITPFISSRKNKDRKSSKPLLSSIPDVIRNILSTPKSQNDQNDLWKTLLVKEIIECGLEYLQNNSDFIMTKSHKRLIEEVKDLVDAIVGISIIVPIEERQRIKF